jgi:uncharacterized protein YwgA
MKFTGKKLILLLLFPHDSGSLSLSIPGRTRLMKMAFLFDKEVWPDLKDEHTGDEKALPEFFAWKFGPFSSELLDDLEFLVNRGFVDVQRGAHATNEELEEYEYWLDESGQSFTTEYVEEVFSLTEKGMDRAAPLWAELTDRQRTLIDKFRAVMVKAPLSRILEYVYKKYEKEGFTDRSLIRDRYLSS